MKPNLLDKFISLLSPEAGLKRLQAKRSYEGALTYSQSNLLKSNNTQSYKIISSQKERLSKATQYQAKNNPFLIKALSSLSNQVVGWGIETKLNNHQDLFKNWSQSITTDGQNIYGLQRRVLEQMLVDGECFLRVIPIDQSFKLQFVPSEYVDIQKNGPDGSNFIKNGVVLDKYERVLGYYIYDFSPLGPTSKVSSFVDANEIIHVFIKDTPSKVRGTSYFNAVLHDLNQLSELSYALATRLAVSSKLTGAIYKESSANPILSSDQSEIEEKEREDFLKIDPGTFSLLRPGEKIIPFIQSPVPGVENHMEYLLKSVAAGCKISYESLTGDLSKVNFSSARIGRLQEQKTVEFLQWQVIIPQLMEKLMSVFKKYAALKGNNVQNLIYSFSPPASIMTNPREEIAVYKDAIRNGLQTLPAALRELGLNPESHLNELAESNKLIDELGLVLDSDPRKQSIAGQAQPNNEEE